MERDAFDRNVDYKAMYLTMARAAETAIRLLTETREDARRAADVLIAAQLDCEERYVSTGETGDGVSARPQ